MRVDKIIGNIKAVCGDKYSPRTVQLKAANQIIEAIDDGKRWIWIAGKTRAGKSELAKAYAKTLKVCKVVEGAQIQSYEDLIAIPRKGHLLIEDVGRNAIKVNNMGNYINVIPYIMQVRDCNYMTIFTSNYTPSTCFMIDNKPAEHIAGRFNEYGKLIEML
jgi:hypothetical protein